MFTSSRLLKIRSVRPTTLTLARDQKVGVQARENMRDVSLIGTSLCDCRIVLWNLSAERVRVLPVCCSQDMVWYVVLVGVSEWCDL